MLQVNIPERELFDENTSEFIKVKGTTLTLEHSLLSLSKWESEHNKPFLGKGKKTSQETLSYIKAMTIGTVDDSVYYAIPKEVSDKIDEYVNAPMTATTFVNTSGRKNNEIITSEIIYYWMITYNIPMECQKWHLNRLMTLIRVCTEKNEPSKKRTKKDILTSMVALNAQRKATLNTKG